MISGWITALATLGSVILALLIMTFGLTVRGTRRWTRMEANIEAQQRTFDAHVMDSRKMHEVMWETMKDDRGATNGRLLFLERQRMER